MTCAYVSDAAGKSTLLQILAGKRLIKGATAKVLDKEVFFNTPPVRSSSFYCLNKTDKGVTGFKFPRFVELPFQLSTILLI